VRTADAHPGRSDMSHEPQNDPPENWRDYLHRRVDRDRPHDMLFSTRLVVGIIIIALGGILLADNLGWFEARYILRSLWPLALVGVGIAMVRSPDHRRSRAWGWVLITVGLWIFADKVGWVHVSFWQLIVPALLLFVGGSLVWRAISGPPADKPQAPGAPVDEHAEFVRSFALMSGCELRPVSRPFRGADLSAVMGGIKLDLTDARMEGDIATVEVFAFWGGIEIYVPPDWTVVSKVTTLMGGFIDKRRPTSVLPAKTLVVRGMVVMSGIEVKN
jgi:predicted membrane protein